MIFIKSLNFFSIVLQVRLLNTVLLHLVPAQNTLLCILSSLDLWNPPNTHTHKT